VSRPKIRTALLPGQDDYDLMPVLVERAKGDACGPSYVAIRQRMLKRWMAKQDIQGAPFHGDTESAFAALLLACDELARAYIQPLDYVIRHTPNAFVAMWYRHGRELSCGWGCSLDSSGPSEDMAPRWAIEDGDGTKERMRRAQDERVLFQVGD